MATATPPTVDSATNRTGAWKPELHDLPIDAIDVGSNVRSDVGDVTELAGSIETHGLLSPIRVAESGAGRYELVYGQRRLAAARHIGLKTIPAIVDGEQLNAQGRTVEQLLENLQRDDLNALDTAKAYRQLLDAGLSQRQLAEQISVSQPTIANTLALLKQPEAIQERVASGELTRSHVEVLAKLPTAEREEVARRVVEHGLSTRDLENEITLASRRAADEHDRDEERKNASATRLASVIDLLAKKKTDPAKVTLVGYAGTSGDVLEQLKPLGWKVKLGDSSTPAKGICDCSALRLGFNYEWPGGKQVEKVSLSKACISSKHQAAARKADQEAYEEQERERKEAAAKAQAERDAALTPIAAAVVTPIPPAKGRLLLYAMVDVGHNGYWQAGELAVRLGVKLSYDGWREQLWKAISDLDHGRLLGEIAYRVAECVVDAGDKHPMRTVVDGLIEPKIADPQPDRPSKPPKPPKAREQG